MQSADADSGRGGGRRWAFPVLRSTLWLRRVFAVALLLCAAVSSARGGGDPCACPGDCNRDCVIAEAELLEVVAALFDAGAQTACAAADIDGDGRVGAADLVGVIAARISPPLGCMAAALPTSTPTLMSPTASPTPTGIVSTWLQLESLPGGPRQEVGVAALGSVIYVIGGFAPAGTSRVEAYDVAGGEWSARQPLPVALQHVGAAALDGFVYSVGGFVGNTFEATAAVYRYDPSRDEWDEVEALPRARGGGAVAVLDGRIHLVGGTGPLGTAAEHFAYDPTTDRWQELEPLPVARNHLAAAALGDALYVVGGRFPLSARLDRYDPDAGWTNLARMPTARAGHAVAALHGSLVALGGEGNAADERGIFPQVELYDPVRNRWTALEDMAVPRHGIGAVVVGDLVYVPGGATSEGFGPVNHFDALRIGE